MTWRDWYTHDVVNANAGANTTLSAPLGHINVHIRGGSILLLHAKPAYTTEETRQGPYSLLVSQATDGAAFGSAYIDDGVSSPPGANRIFTFTATRGEVRIVSKGGFDVTQKLDEIVVLGTGRPGGQVTLQDQKIIGWKFIPAQNKLVVPGLQADLNEPVVLTW